MSRATTIWVVRDLGANTTCAAFTVRHEMITWLKGQSFEFVSRASVIPFMDGPPTQLRGPVRMPQKASDVLAS